MKNGKKTIKNIHFLLHPVEAIYKDTYEVLFHDLTKYSIGRLVTIVLKKDIAG